MRKYFAFALALAALHANAQEDGTQTNSSAFNTEKHFYGSEPIFTGQEHSGYSPDIEGTAYYGSDQWQNGSVVYRDVVYPDVRLKYDLVADRLIVQHYNGFTGVTLFTPRIQSFSLEEKNFENLSANTVNRLPLSGIYEVLVKGEVSIYAKRLKSIQESTKSGRVERSIVSGESYYASKDGVFYPIKKEKHLLDLMPDRKNEIHTLLREKGLRFKKQMERALVASAEYYNAQTRR